MGRTSNKTPWDVLAVVAAGGVLGSMARWGIGEALPVRTDGLPWATLTANVGGAFCIGLLMVLVDDVRPAQRYIRPFWGVGVLGGFTTFSAYAVELRAALAAGHAGLAASYLVATLGLGLAAAVSGLLLGRRWYGAPQRAEGAG